MKTFTLTDEQEGKVTAFYEECKAELARRCAEDVDAERWEFYPNLEYVFVPTGLGDGVEVRDSMTQRRLNITDYSNW